MSKSNGYLFGSTLLWLCVGLVVVYTGAWYYFAQDIKQRVTSHLGAVSYEEASVSGYPFAFKVHFRGVHFSGSAGGMEISSQPQDTVGILSHILKPEIRVTLPSSFVVTMQEKKPIHIQFNNTLPTFSIALSHTPLELLVHEGKLYPEAFVTRYFPGVQYHDEDSG